MKLGDLANAVARCAGLASAPARCAGLADAPARCAGLADAPARRPAVSRWIAGLAVLTAIALVTMWSTGPADARGAVTRPAAAQTGILPPDNPSRSLPPSPNFTVSPSPCLQKGNGSPCNRQVLKAITHARKVLEKMAGMSFSLAAYLKLTRPEALFVTANLERINRGLPPATVLSKSLNTVAQIGAKNDEDPPFSHVPAHLPGGGTVVGLGGNWAGGWPNALAADYAWMYDDGLNSPNLDCTKANKSGCWGHRDNILGTFSSSASCGGGASVLAMGAGYAARTAKGISQTELFAGLCGKAPTDVVLTWTRARKLLGIK